MKRTGEIIFTVIGMVIFGLMVLGAASFLFADNATVEQLIEEVMQKTPETDLSAEEVTAALESGATTLLIVSIVGIVLGGISIFLLIGNKNPKIAGIILLITAVLGTVLTAFYGLFAGAAYLIAGIIALVRKEKQMVA
ncbi:DUF4064 domain-containing protein [Virgibacillus proomii]|uniref:DUF4064 domain-containing protein n=1 Tax=Virgibacillus proomii TaxID=84407 RepID=UPI001C11AEDE|nr:DUF4064 domain-containing protein [Virgibacillus proomii]MBU5265547.1 DUF4064 domain-containing protein [Virgibacillus proomii]